MRTCLSSQLRSMSGKQGTTSLGRTEELPSPQRGSPFGEDFMEGFDMLGSLLSEMKGKLNPSNQRHLEE